MDTNYQAEQQYLAAERDLTVRELMGEDEENVVESPYCGHCGTALDENGNCLAYPTK